MSAWQLAAVCSVDQEKGTFKALFDNGVIVTVIGTASLAVGERIWIRESKEPGHGPIDVERAVYNPVGGGPETP